MPVTKTCANPECGRTFSGPPAIMAKRTHCSKPCQRRRASYVCEGCGKTGEARICEMPRRFCGHECRLAWFSTQFTGEASPHWQGGKVPASELAWRQANPKARSAHEAVRRALRVGRLVRPDTCSACGKACTPQAHHEDYARPLDVAWLCPSCHKLGHLEVA